jgi:hypothetical protein
VTVPASLLLSLAAAAASPTSPPRSASLPVTPAAQQLFEQDWVLMNWALKHFDRNGDILLQPDEAEAAAVAFRKLADSDGDGRVTVEEYRAARDRILSSD